MTLYYWQSQAAQGDWSDRTEWGPKGVPGDSGDLAFIAAGQVVANNIVINNSVILDSVNAQKPSELSLFGSSLGTSSFIVSDGVNNDAFIEFRNSSLQGVIAAGYGPTIMTVDKGYSAVNYGYIGASAYNNVVSLSISDDGNFSNYGYIDAGVSGTISMLFGQQYYNGQ